MGGLGPPLHPQASWGLGAHGALAAALQIWHHLETVRQAPMTRGSKELSDCGGVAIWMHRRVQTHGYE